MRARVLAVFALAALFAGCGESETPRTLRAVRLTVTEPRDGATLQEKDVLLRGKVRPAASEVRVAGRAAEVGADGTWSAGVQLEGGANVLDVTASAPGRQPAVLALRLTLEVPVKVPDLDGRDPEEAVAELEALGLRGRIEKGGGLFDGLLPGDPQVCSSDPEAGTEVRPRTTVTLETAKVC